MHTIVDAMNLIGSRPDGWWRDRPAAILRLLEALEHWAAEDYSDADGVRTTANAHVEAVAALSRIRKGGRLTPAQLRHALDDLKNLWRGIYVHAVSEELLSQAADSVRTHSLRAHDAVHLAGALSFAAGEQLDFACWDKELRDAAKKHGFALVPQHL